MPRIVSESRVTSRVTALDVHAPEIADGAEAGQVVLTRVDPNSPWLPKPLSGVDREKGLITFLSRDENRPKDTEIELSGPFGRLKIADRAGVGKVLFVAEGIGISAIAPLLQKTKENGSYTMIIAGFSSKNDVYWMKRLNESSDELYVVTEDGSYGIKGPVRNTLRAVCEQIADIERVHAAGSLKLLKATADVTRSFSIPATVTLATVFDDADPFRNGDGDQARAAVEGVDWNKSTDLDAHDVDFDALARKFGISATK
jgi:ferredoxin--NADP+ reductase